MAKCLWMRGENQDEIRIAGIVMQGWRSQPGGGVPLKRNGNWQGPHQYMQAAVALGLIDSARIDPLVNMGHLTDVLEWASPNLCQLDGRCQNEIIWRV